MNGSAILSLIAIGGFVWGGFVILLVHAVRRERQKEEEREAV